METDLKKLLRKIKWDYLYTQSIEKEDIRANRFYILVENLNDSVEVVDVKVRSIVEEEKDTTFKLFDSTAVKDFLSSQYRDKWLICDANLEVERTTENISKVETGIEDYLKTLEEALKNPFTKPYTPGTGWGQPNITKLPWQPPVSPGLPSPNLPSPYPIVDPYQPYGPKINKPSTGGDLKWVTTTTTSGFVVDTGLKYPNSSTKLNYSNNSNQAIVGKVIDTCNSAIRDISKTPELFSNLIKEI